MEFNPKKYKTMELGITGRGGETAISCKLGEKSTAKAMEEKDLGITFTDKLSQKNINKTTRERIC